MKKVFNRKVLGYIALALVCVMAGSVLTLARPTAAAETEKVVLTSPFTDAIAKVRDSVVGVYNYQLYSNNGSGSYYGGGSSGYGFPWDFYDFYGFGYGNGSGNGNGNRNRGDNSKEIKYASGSGTVIAKDYVLTNYHVVEDASSLKISVGGDDSNLYEATVAAADEDKDLAVLHVPGLPVEPVELGDSDQLVVGDWAICIGNAIGFTGTVTAGIISGLDREIESDNAKTDRYGRKSKVVNTMIQTDAAINSGNSGGGMFNTAGQLVGIPTLKYSGSRYSSGAAVESIGMCIPINEAKDLIDDAISGRGQVSEAPEKKQDGQAEEPAQNRNELLGKPRLGVTVVTLQGADRTNGAIPNGVYIISLDPNGPAEKAGLQPGDIIVEADGQVIADTETLTGMLKGHNDGDIVTLTVWRSKEVRDAENYDFEFEGDYVENIQVQLEIVDVVAQ